MTNAEYMAEYMRLAKAIRGNWREEEPLLMAPSDTADSLMNWSRVNAEGNRLRAEWEYLVRHWPEMASPATDE